MRRKLNNNVNIEYEFTINKGKEDEKLQGNVEATAKGVEATAKGTEVDDLDDQSLENIEATANNSKVDDLESPSKMTKLQWLAEKAGKAVKTVGKAAEKVGKAAVSSAKAVGKAITTNPFSKTKNHCNKITRRHSYSITVTDKGIDQKKGIPRQLLSTTYLIRHVDIDKCDSVSISFETKNCHLSKAYLFVRFV